MRHCAGIIAVGKNVAKPAFVSQAIVGGTGPTWTAAGMLLGTPNTKRVIVAAVATGDTTGSPISQVQIGGVAATLVARASGSGAMRACALYYRALPDGASADVRVTNSNNASGCFIGLYAIYPSSPTPIDQGTDNTTDTGCSILNLQSAAKGVCIAVSHHRNVNLSGWGGTLSGTWVTNFNAAIGGGAGGSCAMKATDGGLGTVGVGWSGSSNGSAAVGFWGP